MIKNIKIYIKIIFFIFLCTSVNSKDLTGVTLDCYGEFKKMKQYLFYAINFEDSNFVKRSYLFIDRWDPNNEIAKKNSGTYKYRVEENYIQYEWIKKGMSNREIIDRKTLELNSRDFFPINIKCKIVDINKNDPFKKIENYKIPIKKEPKNIL